MSVTDKAINNWENGVEHPDITKLPQIANIFGVTVDYLLQETKSQPMQEAQAINNAYETAPAAASSSVKPASQLVAKSRNSTVKAINIFLLIASCLMFVIYFLTLITESIQMPFGVSAKVGFSIIDMFSSTGFLSIFTALIFVMATLYEIINNIILLSMGSKKYGFTSKVSSIVTTSFLSLASILLVSQILHAYTFVLLLLIIAMLTLSIINLVKEESVKTNKRQGKFFNLQNTIGLLSVISILVFFIAQVGLYTQGNIGSGEIAFIILFDIVVLTTCIMIISSIVKDKFNIVTKIFIILSIIVYGIFRAEEYYVAILPLVLSAALMITLLFKRQKTIN